jgi:phosphoribosylformylglycinamidine synthase
VLAEGVYEELVDNDQLAFVYSKPDGQRAMGEYPHNPNGSAYDLAGICDPSGRVLGMMPHPEKAFIKFTYPDWTKRGWHGMGDGYWIFRNMVRAMAST